MKQLNKTRTRWKKRVLSVTLAIAMVASGLPMSMIPTTVSLAAPGVLETGKVLSSEHVKDQNVLTYYTIVANAQRQSDEDAITYISNHTAQEVIDEYHSNSSFTESGYLSNLTAFPGNINFGNLTVSSIEGMGWARMAKVIDLSQVTLKTGAVTKIPDSEFVSCTGLEQILLPASVTDIGAKAFNGCTALKTLKIGESGSANTISLANVTSIGEYAFNGCTSLTSVDLGADTRTLSLGSYAFSGCSALTAIDIPISDADKIGASAFEGCSKLASATLREGLKYISGSLFQGCGSKINEGLTMKVAGKSGVTLPASVTEIKKSAFQDSNLVTLDLSGCTALETIGEYAFSGITISASSMNDMDKTIILPNGLKNLCDYAFNAADIYLIDIPSTATQWGVGVFSRSLLLGITLPKELTVIPTMSFKECVYLSGPHITIENGSNLEEIGNQAFMSCKWLDTTEFLNGLTKLTKIGVKAFASCYQYEKNGTTEAKDQWGCKIPYGLNSVTLPDCVTQIGDSAFADNYALVEADLGDGIKALPDNLFANTNGTGSGAKLEKVILSKNLTSIGNNVFKNQSRLTTIGYDGKVVEGEAVFPTSLAGIGDSAFYGCGMTVTVSGYAPAVIYVPESAYSTTAKAGYAEYLVEIQENGGATATAYMDESLAISETAYKDLEETEQENYIRVLAVGKKIYYANTVENGGTVYQMFTEFYDTDTECYKNRIYGKKTTVRLEGYSNTKTGGMTQEAYVVPTTSMISGVSTKGALEYTFGLKKVTLPNSVASNGIGTAAFQNCVALEEVVLPEGLSEIKANTFSGCGTYYNKTLYPQDYFGLRKVTIPETVQEIGNNAFQKCYNLKLEDKTGMGSTFGISVKTIGNNAFESCYSLDTIIFPTSLESIGSSAFANCSEQTTVASIIKFEDSTPDYSYKPNLASYGTETIKKGLRTVDFEHAKNLSSIGTAAFQRANVETIDMSPTAVTSIPSDAFYNCTYLRTVILSDKTESILDNAFKDNLELTSLRAPVSSTFKAKSIYGAYGIVAGKTTDPTLQFTNGMNEPVVVPINGSYTLPINALNTDTINSSPAIYITDESGSDHYLYQNGESDASGYRGLTAKVTKDKNGQYVFTLNGSEYITEEITVKVELGMKFQILQSTSYMINNRTVEYQVKVTEVPTSSVTVSAADDTVVKSVPTMYQENSGSKVLYMPSSGNAVTKGIVLTANVAPVETTDEVVWATTDESVVKVEAVSYENGVAKAKITREGTGSATVSITSGTKSDEISVQCQTSVKSLTAKNEGVNLPETFTSATGGLSKTIPYQINANNGGVDKIVVTPVYPDGYDGISGEKVIFTTSNDSIVSVDNTGKITTHAASDEVVTITATAQASGTKKNFYLKVVDDAVMTVGSITISAENDAETVYSGSTLQMNAHVTPANAEDKTVTWKITSGTSYATIDSNGLLTANAKGTVKIQASTPDGKVKSNVYSVKIMIKATDLKVIDGDFAMKIGAQKSIYKTSSKTAKTGWSIVPSNADDTVEWTVDNPEVVSLTVSTSKLTLKALQAGTATLTGVTSSGVSTSVTITVNETGTISSGSNGNSNTNTNTGSNLQEIFASAIVCKVNKPSNKKIYVVKKSKTKLKTILTPANTTDKVTYTSNKTSVATVSTTGVITAKKPGTAKITAKTTSGKATTMTVVVLKKKVKAKKVKVKAAKSVKKGKTIQLKVTLSPSKSTDTISFKSSKKSVATVDAYGLVKAKKKGTVKITVKASSGKKKVVTIKVKND